MKRRQADWGWQRHRPWIVDTMTVVSLITMKKLHYFMISNEKSAKIKNRRSSILGRDYVWGIQYRYTGDVAMVLEIKGEYPNIIVMRRNYSYASISSDWYQQWSDRPRRRRSVLATLNDSSGAPFSITIFMYEEFLVDRKESFLITRRLSSLLYNVGALPSYVHHIS